MLFMILNNYIFTALDALDLVFFGCIPIMLLRVLFVDHILFIFFIKFCFRFTCICRKFDFV